MPGGVWMPVASTVFRLPDQTLAIYSPVRFDDAEVATLDGLGRVAYVIVPNALHHLFAMEASARWPAARVLAASAARAKQPSLRVDHELGAPVAAWRGELELEHVDGAPKLDEYVAFHRPSGTLACADLLFRITTPRNLRTRMVLAVMGVGGGQLAQSRAWRFACRDPEAARSAVARILAWPIERVAPCHGEPLDIDAATLAPMLRRLVGRLPLQLASTEARRGAPLG